MKQENEQPQSDAQITATFLASLQPHSLYEPVNDLPIPAQYGIIVKHLPKSNIIETAISLGPDAEHNLLISTGNNTQNTCEGIIMAVGPKCSPDPRIGLKIQFSTMTYDQCTKIDHRGKKYLAMDEFSILLYIPDETTLIDNGVKDPRQVRREKKVPEQQGIINRLHGRDMNEKDKEKDKTKGKIRPVSIKLK